MIWIKIIFVLILLLALYFVYEFLRVRSGINIAQNLINKSEPFKLTGGATTSLLVLGDSTAVGVGASSPNESLPALFANYVGATNVENYAVSGAKITDLKDQIKQAKETQYDYILLQIGANNIIARQSAQVSREELENILPTLPKYKRLVHLSCGNIGATKLIPYVARNYYTKLTLEYHDEFEKLAQKNNYYYINLYQKESKDKFYLEPKKYLAEDSFHPSSLGYKLWFDILKQQLEN